MFTLEVTLPGEAEGQAAGEHRSAGLAWAEGVRMGHMSREALERQLTLEVAAGRMDPADAEAARQAADA